MVSIGLPCLVGGVWWVWMLSYEVQVFFTGEDPDDSILFLPVLWIPGAILASLGFWLTLKAIIILRTRS